MRRVLQADRVAMAHSLKRRKRRDRILSVVMWLLGYRVRAWESEIHENARGKILRLTKIALSD
jgi:hypothetical protein